MIQAVLNGKSLNYEYREDILTSTVFGTIKYVRPDMILILFIESAYLYDEDRTTLWQKLNKDGIDLRCYREVEYVFWAWNQNYGEPDLILIFRNHTHDCDDLLLIIEAKFKSGKSGTDENDQLVRYFEAITKDIENFSEASVSNFKGMKGNIIYLTESEGFSDISATNKIIKSKFDGVRDNVFNLSWHQLYKVMENMYPFYPSQEKMIADDLMEYMDKVGLRDFSGISLPDESLCTAFSLPYPVFFDEVKEADEKKTYFDSLITLDIKEEKNIFYRGN